MNMNSFDITEFVLWKKESGNFTGYAKYFGLKQYPAMIKKTKNGHYVVLIKKDPNDKRWKGIGKLFLFDKPIKVRGRKEYKCIGIIKTRVGDFHLVLDDEASNRYLGI